MLGFVHISQIADILTLVVGGKVTILGGSYDKPVFDAVAALHPAYVEHISTPQISLNDGHVSCL